MIDYEQDRITGVIDIMTCDDADTPQARMITSATSNIEDLWLLARMVRCVKTQDSLDATDSTNLP